MRIKYGPKPVGKIKSGEAIVQFSIHPLHFFSFFHTPEYLSVTSSMVAIFRIKKVK